MQTLVEYTTASTTGPIRNLTISSSIPLEPRLEDFLHLHWWKQGPWQAIKNKTQSKDPGVESPVISLYMEDELGRPITPGVKRSVRRDLYHYWNQLYDSCPQDLRIFTEIGLDRKEHFRRTLEGAFPWLRLCEGHWKVDQLWVNYFRTWRQPRTPTPSSNAKEPTPSSTGAVKATSPAPVRSKRGIEEDEQATESASKRHKGKERDLMAPTAFHHSRPISRKKIAQKMARVRLYLVLFITQYTNNV